ncbi:MAG: NifB/NifX family molybdenum-iron cluster-binding protein [Thermoproteota archaeon]
MKIRIAIPTTKHTGLKDRVSKVFGKAKTFTIIDVEDEEVKNIRVIDNPAESYEYGSGPVAVKTLADEEVDWVVTGHLGPGAANILEHYNISHFLVESDQKVSACLKEALSEFKTE